MTARSAHPETSARTLALVLMAGAALSACATVQPKYAAWKPELVHGTLPSGAGGRYKVGEPYQVAGIWYVPKEQPNYDETGTASWYGDAFNNKPTANGEVFDMHAISAAHPTLPMPSMVEVTNLDNGKSLQVRVNDRGPYVGGRLIDLSHAAAHELGYDNRGLAHVRVRYVGPAPLGETASKAPPSFVKEGLGLAASATGSLMSGALAVAAPIAVASATLPPALPAVASTALPAVGSAGLPASGLATAPEPATSALTAPPVPPASTYTVPAPIYRVQAGAFADAAKAARIAAQLGETAEATVEAVDLNGVTLYRVLVAGGEQLASASTLREKVASLGYPDARIVKPN